MFLSRHDPTLTEGKGAVNAPSPVVTLWGIRYNHNVTRRHVRRHPRLLPGLTIRMGCVLVMVALSMPGCSLLKGEKQTINTEPIPLTPAIWFSPSGTTAEIPYQNACHERAVMPVAELLLGSIPKKLAGVFTGVTAKHQSEDILVTDGVVEVGLGLRRIDVDVPKQSPGEYPASATVGLEMVFLARDGSLLFSRKLEGTAHGTVVVAEQSCDIAGLDAIVEEAVTSVADGLAQQIAQSVRIREYAGQREQWVPLASGSVGPSVGAFESAPSVGQELIEKPPVAGVLTVQPAQLSFRAILRDESRDQVLEPDESLTIHLEVKNDGAGEAKDVVLLVDGKAGLDHVFPSEVVVGSLQPGEIKRISVTERVTATEEALPGELMLNLRSASPMASVPRPKIFNLGIKPKRSEVSPLPDVDEMPKLLAAGRQPKAIIVAIGIGTYQDEQVPGMKYASHDAAVMAEYLHAIGSIPRERMRILLDRQAVQQEFEETFEQWLRTQADAETVLYVYFSGRAVVDSNTGEVLLVPYNGTLFDPAHLYSLRRLQEALSRLPLQRAILMFDTSLDPSPGADLTTMPSPDWTSGMGEERKDVEMWMVGNRNLQEAHVYDQGKHGLFTYHLLRGLQGVADLDRDGTVMAGELCLYARGQVARVTREHFGSKQDPLCVPPVGRGAMIRIHPMARGNNPKPSSTEKSSEEPPPDITGPDPSQILVGP